MLFDCLTQILACQKRRSGSQMLHRRLQQYRRRDHCIVFDNDKSACIDRCRKEDEVDSHDAGT